VSEHRVEVEWQRGDAPFTLEYDRDHTWRFDGGTVVAASSAPSLMGSPDRVDPEEAFVAAISSCHMMWFLFLAAKAGFTVESYRDDAVGYLERERRGVMSITRVELDPHIEFSPSAAPDADTVRALHEESHARCFIANSVRSEIIVRER
jgi:organic hydroperoxide reductase OsmC/OhrA